MQPLFCVTVVHCPSHKTASACVQESHLIEVLVIKVSVTVSLCSAGDQLYEMLDSVAAKFRQELGIFNLVVSYCTQAVKSLILVDDIGLAFILSTIIIIACTNVPYCVY
jgi:hypothetical protein